MPTVTLTALIERRAAMAAEIEEARDHVAVLEASLKRLDRLIRLHGSNREPEEIEPQRLLVKARKHERGPIVRPILTILRTAHRPMTVREIALGVIAARGLDATDIRVVRNVRHQVKLALNNQRANGVVTPLGERGKMRWVITL